MTRDHVNWPEVLSELAKHGLDADRLARVIGVGRTTVLGWRAGSEPSHADGEVVLREWVVRTGRGIAEAPREVWFGRRFRVFR